MSACLQNAFWRSAGVPLERRTDSLSAAYNNLAEKGKLIVRDQDLCRHYSAKATRNTPELSHDNGAIESPYELLKRRICQALLLRGSHDFEWLEEYLLFIVSKISQRCASSFSEERSVVQGLHKLRTLDYAEHRVLVSDTGSFDLKRVIYTRPSLFVGKRLHVLLHDEPLVLFHGHEQVLVLPRVYASKHQRAGA